MPGSELKQASLVRLFRKRLRQASSGLLGSTQMVGHADDG